MSAGLARYLKDFSEPRSVLNGDADSAFPGSFSDHTVFPALTQPEPEPVDIDVERRDAHAAGYAAATADLTRRHAEELEALAEKHRQDIAALVETHTGEIANVVSSGLSRIAGLIAHEVSEQAAIALAPILTAELTRNAVDDLADLIKTSVLEGAVGSVIVKGPAPLFEMLEKAMTDKAALLRHVEATDLDLSVEIEGSVLVTRMSAWAASLKKVLE